MEPCHKRVPPHSVLALGASSGDIQPTLLASVIRLAQNRTIIVQEGALKSFLYQRQHH